MKETCDNFGELLVDYADGLLGTEDAAKVAGHLGECDDCRKLVDSLSRSLELTQVIWEDNLSQGSEIIRMPVPAKTSRHSWLRYAAAAVIVIVSGALVTQHAMKESVQTPPTFAEMEQKIAEAGSAARLLAAADLLVGYSNTETIARQQYRRIVETYPHTPAATKAKSHIE
ncbi:MAG: anti-sigma factor family protein [Planctomycetota bacterium]|jgi:predicted anti-sigma-YlaC factor YlaD